MLLFYCEWWITHLSLSVTDVVVGVEIRVSPSCRCSHLHYQLLIFVARWAMRSLPIQKTPINRKQGEKPNKFIQVCLESTLFLCYPFVLIVDQWQCTMYEQTFPTQSLRESLKLIKLFCSSFWGFRCLWNKCVNSLHMWQVFIKTNPIFVKLRVHKNNKYVW